MVVVIGQLQGARLPAPSIFDASAVRYPRTADSTVQKDPVLASDLEPVNRPARRVCALATASLGRSNEALTFSAVRVKLSMRKVRLFTRRAIESLFQPMEVRPAMTCFARPRSMAPMQHSRLFAAARDSCTSQAKKPRLQAH